MRKFFDSIRLNPGPTRRDALGLIGASAVVLGLGPVPAYAATIHKSQGSEYPAVIIPVLTQHYAMLQRNLLYTGVTRGKKLVVLIADPRAIGLALAVTLTAMSFWVANTSLLWVGGISLGLTVLAIAQMGIHLVFFLHVTTGPDNTNNVMALAFGVLIVALVVVGSLVIMADLNDNMMPGPELMNMQMQR